MKISETQLRRIIRSVINENRKNAYDFSDLSPANEFRPDTVGKTSYVDPVMQAKKDMYAKMERRRQELERQGKQEFADELQAIFDDVLG